MRRFFCLALGLCLLLAGCRVDTGTETAVFYYVQTDYQTAMSTPIGGEYKEISGHSGDLSYLLHLYLMGPSQSTLASPLPRGCQLLSVEQNTYGLQIRLSDVGDTMTDAAFSLACACLTLTFQELAQVQTVTVTSGSRKVTMDRESVTLFDSGATAATEESA